MARILIRMTTSPYGTSAAAEGLDFALSATNYGHAVQILFEGQGVFQLLNHQQPDDMLNHLKRLNALSFFDIEECFVCEESFKALKLDKSNLADFVGFVAALQKTQLFEAADHVVTF